MKYSNRKQRGDRKYCNRQKKGNTIQQQTTEGNINTATDNREGNNTRKVEYSNRQQRENKI